MQRRVLLTTIPLLLASLLPAVPASQAAPASPEVFRWRPMGGVRTPGARDHHTAVWTGSEMIIWGGGGGGGGDGPAALGTGWRYNPTTDLWTEVADAGAPSPRHDHAGVWTGTEMLIWGGTDGFSFQGDGAAYNPQTNSWRALPATGAPSARAHFVYAWTGTELLIWGGRNAAGALGDGARYNPTTNTWAPMAARGAPAARVESAGAWSGTELIVFGGRDNQTVYGDGARYNPTTNSWVALPASGAPAARYRHATVWADSTGYVLVWGGCTGTPTQCTYTNDGARYRPATDRWTPMAASPLSPRTGFSATWTNRSLSIWGGWDGSTYFRDGARYFPQSDTWQSYSTTFAPQARRYHSAVFTGSELIIWGGTGMLAYGDGGRFGTSWRKIRPGQVPEPRHGAPAVWTGSEMIFYGGEMQYENQRSGGRYVPATDSWTPMGRLPNWLGAYALHTAVWTGAEMAIYGGYTDIANWDGAAYTPSTSTWRHIPEYLPATPRELHTAVWTGTKMIAFGGDALNQAWNRPIAWDPASNTWSTLSTTGAPAERLKHSAVWTGTEMVVWGGMEFDCLNAKCDSLSPNLVYHMLRDGGAYNPTTDTWRPIADPPQQIVGRINHVTVWTGSEMIIWGGQSGYYGDTYLNDGAAYNPTTNTWRVLEDSPLSTRSFAVGLWTTPSYGVFIWGGQTGRNGFANDGAFYNPSTGRWTLAVPNTLLTARAGAQAVFTGSAALIWGGWNQFEDFNDGASYGP